ncbi:caspase-1-like [Formica exsecta]|uniref:caspase-1-like n=1 Tax=Formica exsecta TaxID=72781 RepID=UPI0011433DE1|nr:caspase-1-like [Formica exsecta]XP_029665204.1 caspase-1-like [Formica exsecta]XP_029665205.1 caspase-1-like [Formica exsecta]
MEERDNAKCITERKQQNVSLPDMSQWSVPDGWPFRKANSSRHSIDTQKAVKIDLDPFAEEYDMNHKRRGVALILNHVHFESMSTRKGSVKDSLHLKVSLSKLGFDVRIYTDPTVKVIAATLQSTAAEDHTDADCLIVVAMSHGESGLLHSTDSLYPVDMLWTPFTGDRCSTLAGKPKLFFIQACRGSQLDKGVKIIHETDSKRTTYSIPTYADIMVAYSTYDGFYSWRNPDVGSWFIQALCEELDLHGRKRDLLSLMTSVNRRVAIEYQSYVPQNEKFHGKKQIPSIVSMLTRLVYFPDKCTSIPDDLDDVSEEKKSQVCEKVT